MRNIIFYILILSSPIYLLSDTSQEQPKQETGQAAKEGKNNSTTIVWAVFGIVFLVTIGVIAAVAISRDNNDNVIIIQH